MVCALRLPHISQIPLHSLSQQSHMFAGPMFSLHVSMTIIHSANGLRTQEEFFTNSNFGVVFSAFGIDGGLLPLFLATLPAGNALGVVYKHVVSRCRVLCIFRREASHQWSPETSSPLVGVLTGTRVFIPNKRFAPQLTT